MPTFAVCEKFVVMEINNEEKLDTGKLILELREDSGQLNIMPFFLLAQIRPELYVIIYNICITFVITLYFLVFL